MRKLTLLFALSLGPLLSCTPREQTTTKGDSVSHIKNDTVKMIRKPLTNVLEENTHLWMEIPGVIGTGEGQTPNGDPAIIIFAERSASEVQGKMPYEKDGYPIIVREIGTVKPLEMQVHIDTSIPIKKK